MRKIIVSVSLLTVLLGSITVSGQGYDDLTSNNNYNIIPPSPESFYKSKFGNTEINDFKGEPTVNIPVFSLSKKDIAVNLGLKYIKSGVKVNDLPNSTGMNWILDTGGSITRTIYDKRDEFFGNTHTINHSLPSIDVNDTQGWGAYIGLHTGDHEVDVFNYSISGYSGSFYMDENFNPVLITKDNNLKIETIGNFRDNYAFKITTYDGLVYLFGGDGFTETTFNKETPTLAGVTGFYLKQISSNKTNRFVNFIYENMTPKTVILNEQQNVNITSDILFTDSCGGEGQAGNQINSNDNILHITSLKRLKQIVADDNETFTFNYSNDNVIYNKLTEVVHSNNNNPVRKVTMDYLDKKNGNILERFFLTKVSFFEYNNSIFNKKEDYSLEYNSPLNIPFRLSKEIDYLGFYNGKVNNTSLIPNINLFDNTNFPNFNSFADRTPDFDYSVYGTLKSITYPTKGKTNFEYEPIKKGIKSNELNLEINNAKMTDIKELGKFEFIGGNIDLSISLYSPDTSSPIKAWADFKILDDNNNEVYTHSMAVTKITNQLETDLDQFTLEPNKKYKFTYQVKDNKCNSCQGNVTVTYKGMDPSNGAGVRLKRQYDVSENNMVNVKRIYYTNFDDISKDLFTYDNISPNFQTTVYTHSNTSTTAEAETCAAQEHRQYLGWGTLSKNLESSPISNSLEIKNGFLSSNGNTVCTYFNLADPMYENVTISYGGDHFEKGGEEKKYFIKDRNTLKSDLFIPTTMELPAVASSLDPNSIATGILFNITPSAQRKLDRYYSFSNIDGKLLKNSVFYMKNNVATLQKSAVSTYTFEDTIKIYNIIGSVLYPNLYSTPTSIINKYVSSYPIITTQSFLSKVVAKEYMEDIPLGFLDDSSVKKLITTKEYFYNNPSKQLTKQTTTTPENSINETSYKYAQEKGNQLMIDKNMIGIPLETLVVKKQTTGDPGKMISKSEIIYPVSQAEANENWGFVFPLSVKSYDIQSNALSTDITYDKYDSKGNLQQYTTKDGLFTAIVWGYNQTQPIAKIVGARIRDIQQSLIDSIVNASNVDASASASNDESSLLTALDGFRKDPSMAGYQITTYTYDPLIGVRSITPPSGIREVYIYDSANRLKEIRENNQAGNILKEFKYNYKN